MNKGRQLLKEKENSTHGIIKEQSVTFPVKKTYIVAGLHCANCAVKIENEIKRLPGVSKAHLDFVSKKLVLELRSGDELDEIQKKANDIVKRIESGARLKEETEQDQKEVAEHDKLWLLILGASLFFVASVFHLTSVSKFVLYLISLLLIGGEVFLKAVKNILKGQVFDENFLMGIAAAGAFAIGEYSEGVAVMLFYQIGELFQEMAVNKSRKSITALMDIRPEYANRKIGMTIEKVSPEQVTIGDLIVVKPGEKVPLDGVVTDGISMLDTSALTGESVRREVFKGCEVLSGSINMNGLLTIKVTKAYSESTVSKILDLVENASAKKAPVENFVTKFARIYTPVVVMAAAIMALVPPLFIHGATFSQWIHRALVFLVVSCPCALVISIPLGFFGGIGGASANGILIKGGNFLEALNHVDTVVFDKTGTLTKGVFDVTKIVSRGRLTQKELLEYAAYAENYSNHPIALSILKTYGENINKNLITGFNETMGLGIKVTIRGQNVLAGNEKLLKEEKVYFKQVHEPGTVVYIAINRQYEGHIVISDQMKADSKKTLLSLKRRGVKKLVMLTGDRKEISEKIAEDLGLDEVYAELLPHQKVEVLETLAKQMPANRKLVFVGDGINDAPVLARADIGVAMGGLGSDAAIEAADIVLMTDEPSKLITAFKIADKTRKIVWQNIVFALAVKGIVLVLGAGGMATMWEAVFADVGVALLAILNALRVLKTR